MLSLLSLSVLALLCLPHHASALKIIVGSGRTECVSHEFTQDQFQVPGGARVEGAVFVSTKHASYTPYVSIRVHGPSGAQIWSQQNVQVDAHFNLAAQGAGTYKVCFFNGWETRVDATIDLVYFTLGHLRRPGQLQVPKGTVESRSKEVASHEHLDAVKRNVVIVQELVDIVSGEQRYLHRKLERHMRTVNSSNTRTFWYASLEVAVLLALTGLQVAAITHLFAKKGGMVRITV